MMGKIRKRLAGMQKTDSVGEVPLLIQAPPCALILDLPDVSISVSARTAEETSELFGMILAYKKVQEGLGKPGPFEEGKPSEA